MSVRILSLNDLFVPFEHDLFIKISRAFPLINELILLNICAQQKKLTDQLNEHEQTCSIIEYLHRVKLNLNLVHIDYVKQFIFNTKTRLPHLNTLYAKYDDLMTITENFTNDAARDNCVKLKSIIFDSIPIVFSKNFYLYFPSL
ncbi:unnamed protein product [Rotaria sp. Silwood1]|nr:unnamed protein product [Rotaria sp. Silwood1]CAF0962764.1 unnamed protein product [Rotaria sp. Silwood1]CAF3372369.1 unnamed protein product [Rotaria sp. Silwood1]CAF3380538.1 unnamed protein product [Rotaria sp. Silwood1]CAF4924501.1 unnamed protein product [Rotaria sp. Silwood1]